MESRRDICSTSKSVLLDVIINDWASETSSDLSDNEIKIEIEDFDFKKFKIENTKNANIVNRTVSCDDNEMKIETENFDFANDDNQNAKNATIVNTTVSCGEKEINIETENCDYVNDNQNSKIASSISNTVSCIETTIMEQQTNTINVNYGFSNIPTYTNNISNSKKTSETVKDVKSNSNTSKVNCNENTTKQKKVQMCILCAAKSKSHIPNKYISCFAKMIEGFSSVNILKLNVPPTACDCCLKFLEKIFNFGKQITYTSNLITTTNIFKKHRELISKAQENTVVYPKNTNENTVIMQKENSKLKVQVHETSCKTPKEIMNLNKTEIQIVEKENTADKQKVPSETNQKEQNAKVKRKNKVKKGKVQCTECGTLFKNLEALHNHQKFRKRLCRWKHYQVSKTNENKNTQPEPNLNLEKNYEDDDDDMFLMPFSCTVCGKPYTYRNVKYCSCKEPAKQKEVLNEKFVCTLCGKQYPRLSYLWRHEITHGEKKHLCSICGEAFHFLLYLERHMIKHTGKRPFSCLHCDKTFATRWNLIQHKRLHTKSFPYKCRLCPAAYRHNVTLKRHVVMSHTASECAMSSAKGTVNDKVTRSVTSDESNVNTEVVGESSDNGHSLNNSENLETEAER